jgi:hypothetical protein
MRKFEIKITLGTLWVRVGRTAALWAMLTKWQGWRPYVERGAGSGRTIYWLWAEVAFNL